MKKEKGSLLSSSALIWVIIGLALGILLIGIVSDSGLDFNNNARPLTGDTERISQQLASKAEACWKQHRGSSNSLICTEVEIKAEQRVTEANITQRLNCQVLENADYGCGQSDELDVGINCQNCSVKIQYLPGRIAIRSLD